MIMTLVKCPSRVASQTSCLTYSDHNSRLRGHGAVWQWENSSTTCKRDSFVTLRAFCASCKESNWWNIESEGKKNKLQTHSMKCQSPKLGRFWANRLWITILNTSVIGAHLLIIDAESHAVKTPDNLVQADGWIAELCIHSAVDIEQWVKCGSHGWWRKAFFVIIHTTSANVPQRSDSYTSHQQFSTVGSWPKNG